MRSSHQPARAGQLVNVLLCGILIGMTLYSVIRHAEITEAEFAFRRLTYRERLSYMDSGCFAPAVNIKETNL